MGPSKGIIIAGGLKSTIQKSPRYHCALVTRGFVNDHWYLSEVTSIFKKISAAYFSYLLRATSIKRKTTIFLGPNFSLLLSDENLKEYAHRWRHRR